MSNRAIHCNRLNFSTHGFDLTCNVAEHNFVLRFIFQIFQDGELTHYVDGAGDQRNWMKYVNCARHDGEQNLVLVQEEGEVFYEVCKEVPEGCELLVWYGDTYLKYMGIPITMKTKLAKIENDGAIGMEPRVAHNDQ